jgi:hypothetical protein
MRLFDSHGEQEVSISSDRLLVLEERLEVHHLLVLMEFVILDFHECAVWVLWIVITLEFVEVRGLGLVRVSMGGVI